MSKKHKIIMLGGSGGGGAVTSVFSRAGDVVADSDDYSSFYGQLSVDNTWSGVNTHSGSFIFTRDPVTVTANAGTINVAKGHSTVSISANVELTPSAAGTVGQQICVIVINAGATALTVTGAGTASTISFTAAANSTTTTYWSSSGTAWTVVGGAVTILDISLVTPVLTDSIAFWDASGGLTGRALLSTLQGIFVAARLGSHTTPDTTAGAITWTAPVYEVFANTTTEYDLPAAAGYDGKAVVFYNTGSNVLTIDPNGSEVIVRDGTVQTGGVTMTLTAGAGNYVALICDGVRWITLGFKGTLAQGS